MRFPWSSIDTIDDVLKSPQLDSRKFFVPVPLFKGGPSAAMPGLPFKFSSVALPEPRPSAQLPDEFTIDAPESRPGEFDMKDRADEKLLGGLRVLDLTRMLSGPYATRILADFGAEVIKIQSRKTAHGAERNDTAYFAAWNRNKQSITLDLDNPDAKEDFLRLAAESDIVLENYSTRVLANWGLEYERLREVNPKIVMVSISAMGHTGPWKDFVGFAPTFHALSGLISATSGILAPPADIGYAYADVIAGLYAALATLSAIRCRDETGKGQHVDLSAYEAMCTFIDPGSEIRDSRLGSRIYRCKGKDRWCVVAVDNEKEVDFVESLAGGFESRTPEEVVEQLQNGGIAAGVVQNAADLAQDEQLRARRFFVSLDHPKLGMVISDRSALWDWRQRPKHWKASPLLGEHNKKFGIRD
jgi:crotonobetainyl-CoA:carnitine CoA-transferase CaiB-like acyl-CoA transferase